MSRQDMVFNVVNIQTIQVIFNFLQSDFVLSDLI